MFFSSRVGLAPYPEAPESVSASEAENVHSKKASNGGGHLKMALQHLALKATENGRDRLEQEDTRRKNVVFQRRSSV